MLRRWIERGRRSSVRTTPVGSSPPVGTRHGRTPGAAGARFELRLIVLVSYATSLNRRFKTPLCLPAVSALVLVGSGLPTAQTLRVIPDVAVHRPLSVDYLSIASWIAKEEKVSCWLS